MAAQIIRLSDRQAMGRPRRTIDNQPCVVLTLFRAPALAMPQLTRDDDRAAGRGRDPG